MSKVGLSLAHAFTRVEVCLHTVTTSSKEYRMKEQLEVFAPNWPLLTEQEILAYEHCNYKA